MPIDICVLIVWSHKVITTWQCFGNGMLDFPAWHIWVHTWTALSRSPCCTLLFTSQSCVNCPFIPYDRFTTFPIWRTQTCRLENNPVKVTWMCLLYPPQKRGTHLVIFSIGSKFLISSSFAVFIPQPEGFRGMVVTRKSALTSVIFLGSFSNLTTISIVLRSRTSSVMEIQSHKICG